MVVASVSAAILHRHYEGHENDIQGKVIHFTLNMTLMPFIVLSTCLRLPDGRHTLGSDCSAPVYSLTVNAQP